MLWTVTVRGIEIPVRAPSRRQLVHRLCELLGESFEKVTVADRPEPDVDGLVAKCGIRIERARLRTGTD